MSSAWKYHLLLLLVGLVMFAKSFPFIAPTSNTSHSNHLDRRQCEWKANADGVFGWVCDGMMPTMKQIVRRMWDINDQGKATRDNHAWFYSRSTSKANWATLAMTFLASFDVPGYGYPTGLSRDWWEHQNKDIIDNQDSYLKADPNLATIMNEQGMNLEALFQVCYSQALAVATINPQVFFFTIITDGKPAPWSEDSVWHNYEAWILTQNPRVRTIYAVDPRPEAECHTAIVWWQKDDASTYNGGKPLTGLGVCPFWDELFKQDPAVEFNFKAMFLADMLKEMQGIDT